MYLQNNSNNNLLCFSYYNTYKHNKNILMIIIRNLNLNAHITYTRLLKKLESINKPLVCIQIILIKITLICKAHLNNQIHI